MSCLTTIIRLCVVLTPANTCGPHSASVAWHDIDFAFFVKLSLVKPRLINIPYLEGFDEAFSPFGSRGRE